MRKPGILIITVALILFCCACRIRVVKDPMLADQKLRLAETHQSISEPAEETASPTSPPAETETAPETTNSPETTLQPETDPPESTISPETSDDPTEPPPPPPTSPPPPPTTEAPPATVQPPTTLTEPESETPPVSTEPTAPATTAPPETAEPPESSQPAESSAPTETNAPTEPTAPESENDTPEPQPGPGDGPADPSAPVSDQPGEEPDPSADPTDDTDAPSIPEIIQEEETEATEELDETQTTGILVTFDPNGGESAVVTTVVMVGEPYGVLPGAQWRGRSFDGWWTEPAGGVHVTADTIVTTETDHTLFAHWIQTQGFVLTFDGNGGRVKSKEARLQLRAGEPIGNMPVPVREGWDFLGWWTEPEGGGQIFPETAFDTEIDRTAYAHWEYNPIEYWTFTLQNKTQQIYLCQQEPVYLEIADHMTQIVCPLITDTGSCNIAAYLNSPETTDDWVEAKNPAVILRCVSSMEEADAAYTAMSGRFPGRAILIVKTDALGSGPSGIYARLALAKYLYGDWYTDVDLTVVAAELSLDVLPIYGT